MIKTNMLTLYRRPECPFCRKVLDMAEESGIALEKKDISNPTVANELVAKGGKKQVPYLFDSETGVVMYESMDIIAYLRAHYAPGAKPV